MNYDKFVNYITDEVAGRLGEDYCCFASKVTKNNGIKLTGLTIRNKKANISPTLYLESYFEQYEAGESIDCIVGEIISNYDKYKIEEADDFEFIYDYEVAKEDIYCRLINADMNRELLTEVPHVIVMDLAVVFYVSVSTESFSNGSVLIKNTMLENWDISLNRLYEDAVYNTRNKAGFQFMDIKSIILSMFEQKYKALTDCSENETVGTEDLYEDIKRSENIPMFVISNKDRQFGAAAMLYNDLFQEFALNLNSNLYILPSSIHELIIIPDDNTGDEQALADMVKTVNTTQLARHEILSDSVYYYDLANRSFSKVA